MSVSEAGVSWPGKERSVGRTRRPQTMAFVDVETSQSATAEYRARSNFGEAGRPLDLKQLENDISGAFGRGTYESIYLSPGYR